MPCEKIRRDCRKSGMLRAFSWISSKRRCPRFCRDVYDVMYIYMVHARGTLCSRKNRRPVVYSRDDTHSNKQLTPMANRERREALRGAETETLDLLSEVLGSQEWVELLRAPLELTAGRGNRGLAQKLVRAGAEIGNALHEAAGGGHEGIVNDLLAGGASVTALDRAGDTPLHSAAQKGKREIVSILVLKGGGKDVVNLFDLSPLHLAVCGGHVGAAQALMAAGAD